MEGTKEAGEVDEEGAEDGEEEEEVEVGEIAVAGTSANFLFSFDVFSFCFR